jgi:hypothetical protein
MKDNAILVEDNGGFVEDNGSFVEDNGTCVGDNASRVEVIEASVDVALPHPLPCKAFGKYCAVIN